MREREVKKRKEKKIKQVLEIISESVLPKKKNMKNFHCFYLCSSLLEPKKKMY